MNLSLILTTAGISAAVIATVLLIFIRPLWRRLRTTHRDADTYDNPGGTPPGTTKGNRNRKTTLWVTLFLVLALFLWDHYYNDVDSNELGDLLEAVIEFPLYTAWVLLGFIAAVWCCVNFLAEPTGWAKHIGAVIIIGLTVTSVIPLAFAIFGDDWFTDLVDDWALSDWPMSTIIMIGFVIALWAWGFWSDRKESKK